MNAPYGLITGATSGIGKAFAFALAEQKINLILTGRREVLLKEIANELRQVHNIDVILHIGELNDGEIVNELVQKAQSVDLLWLVNNAGFGGSYGFFQEESDFVQSMINVHTWVPVKLCKELIPRMVQNKKGFVVNVSSLASQFTLPGSLVYTSTKAMLHNFTLSLSVELWGTGVRVQSLLPGFTYTDFHEKLENFPLQQKSKGIVRWQSAQEVAQTSLKRILGRGWKKTIFIPGWSNKLLLFLINLLPFSVFRNIARRIRVSD